MCGIVAVLRRPSSRPAPAAAEVLADLDRVAAELGAEADRLRRPDAAPTDPERLRAAAGRLQDADRALRGSPGLECLLGAPGTLDQLSRQAQRTAAAVADLEAELDQRGAKLDVAHVEEVNAALVVLKDVAWALSHDRVEAARGVADLAGVGPDGTAPGRRALDAWWSIEVALRAIDRLEVRGRDSAGVHVLVSGHGLDLASPDWRTLLGARVADPLFTSLAARTPAGCLSLVYKAAAEIGELGDNVHALRAALRSDPLLAAALRSPTAAVTVVGHTRWASVGVISQSNAHPLNSEEAVSRVEAPYVIAALNGDVDNHADLRLSEALALPAEVTTDAKVVPTLMGRRMAEGMGTDDAFRRTVAQLQGSVAIAASAADTPDEVQLALRGSGQGLYVGLAEDAFVVASEAYGLVEETADYVRMDGETTGGVTVTIGRGNAGCLEGVAAVRYDGRPIPLDADDVRTAEITTRDIDRRHFPHFLLKEISEAPQSFRKTLRGKIVGSDDRPEVRLGDDTIPPALRRALAAGALSRVIVVGQGTAAVAGQGVAAAIARCLPALSVSAQPATELSGFGLSDDMEGTLVVAVSQSGTTTDTNRTVDLVRARGAHVVSVVNRRNSDLVDKSHGVLYTSDGRDVEMSVASTKAFYAQIAAGWLLALGLAAAAPRPAGAGGHQQTGDPGRDRRLLSGLRELPDAMEATLERRPHIAAVAGRQAPSRRHWAVVGSGPDRVAAAETRIKLSELCYKAIACDATEDKKHIDLSSEPLILVCAPSLSGPNADDVAKEVAIYRAHQAAPVVIAATGVADRFRDAADVIDVPACEPDLAFVLAAMVGHLFGYEAALAIDAQARPLRAARAVIETTGAGLLDGRAPAAGSGEDWLERLGPELAQVTKPFVASLRRGDCDGHLDARTAVRVMTLLRYATGAAPLEGYELEFGTVATPAAVIGDLLAALTAAIDQLTRPVDAIKHQAKTVTVGISRSEEALLGVGLVKEALNAGAGADQLGYRALRALAALDPAVDEVLGYTRYRIDGLTTPAGAGEQPAATVTVVDQGGIALQLPPSRTVGDPRLRGSKHRAVDEREVTVVRGRSDGRTVILVPETKGGQPVGMTLLHVRFFDRLPVARARAVLTGYRDRYSALTDAVTETEPVFDDERLAEVAMVDLLTQPVYVLAERWQS